MTPLDVLAFTVCATAAAVAAESIAARRRRKALRRLAAEWRMTYSRVDSLRLTPKVARSFPIPGAANLRVTDVIYGIDHERYRYVFRAEFTTGTVRTKKRMARVGTFSEPRDRHRTAGTASISLAPDDGRLVDQYRHLAPAMTPKAPTPQTPATPPVTPPAGPVVASGDPAARIGSGPA